MTFWERFIQAAVTVVASIWAVIKFLGLALLVAIVLTPIFGVAYLLKPDLMQKIFPSLYLSISVQFVNYLLIAVLVVLFFSLVRGLKAYYDDSIEFLDNRKDARQNKRQEERVEE